jgi:cysteine desulfurase
MGAGDLAGCAVRVSGGWATTQADWEAFAEAWIEVHDRHAARRRAPAA